MFSQQYIMIRQAKICDLGQARYASLLREYLDTAPPCITEAILKLLRGE